MKPDDIYLPWEGLQMAAGDTGTVENVRWSRRRKSTEEEETAVSISL